MSKYRDVPTTELERMWNEKRLSLKIGADSSVFRGELDEVYEMRRELDRRRGEVPQAKDVDFGKEYVTD